METWASRCLDNNAVTKAGLHIIEGVYGRDGHFMAGPNDGLANDYMTNCIIFGLNPFYVDIIGHWIGGHEPGNFGLFHMAREDGRIATMNPANIKVYEWDPDTGATYRHLSAFDRHPLKTGYLRRDYDGQSEDYWHMVDEHFDYAAFGDPSTGIAPTLNFNLGVNYPNPVSHRTHIPFQLVKGAPVRLEIIDNKGAVVDVLLDSFMPAGSHMTTWDCQQHPAGLYLYRMRTGGQTLHGKMMVIR
jgi:hypothetical protein